MVTALTLSEAKKTEDTLYVVNNSPNIVTCYEGKVAFQLGPKGTEDSVQVLPKDALNVLGFQRLMMKEMITVSTDDQVLDMITENLRAQEDQKIDDQNKISALVEENSSSKQLVEATCLITGQRVFQTVQQVKDRVPPLAPEHEDKASEFVFSEGAPDENGEPQVKWSRVKIG